MPYLDYAGAALASPKQMEEVCQLMTSHQLANPHSRHASATTTHTMVGNARQRVLSHFNTSSSDYSVVFTSNASHSLRIVAESFEFSPKCQESCQVVSDLRPGPSLAYLKDSHNSVVGLREIVRRRTDWISCLTVCPSALSHQKRSLFVMTAESNFCGRKYDLGKIAEWQEKGWSVCLDAACLVSSSPLDLSSVRPNFVVISFYKMFGFPTGLGALLVRNDCASLLTKRYFSGGTVAAALPSQFISHQRENVAERFEDGTINYYAIATLQKGFDDLDRFGGMVKIERYSFGLAQMAYRMLKSKYHSNGNPAVEVYCNETNFASSSSQGPLVAFNMRDEDGYYIGFSQVSKMADLFGIELRTGCFCNIGACQMYIGLTDQELLQNIQSGKKCGDELDMLNGKSTGAVRISFGRLSTEKDIDVLEQMIDYCFLRARTTTVIQHPLPICEYRPILSKIFCYPVKSCAGFNVQSSSLTPSGVRHDRHFMLVNNDVTLSQKKFPQILRILTKIKDQHLYLSYGDSDETIAVPLEDEAANEQTNVVCVNSLPVSDCGDEMNEWLDRHLEMSGCRMRRIGSASQRSLSNEAPYLMVNEASVQMLADHIGLSLDDAVSRFRPNLVVKGLPPFIEDTATRIKIGNVKFEVTGKCTRCEMICIDQKTGEKDPSMIVALRDMRQREKMTFGIYLKEIECTDTSVICCGDVLSFE